MDTTLVTVTLISMAMALSLSVVVWRMLRDDRRRSEARVQALTELAARRDARSQPARRTALPRTPEIDLPLRPPAPRRPDPPAVAKEIAAAPLFAPPVQESPWGTRAVIIAAIVLALAAVVFAALAARTNSTISARQARGPVARAEQAPLELLSLRDMRQPDALTITGLVQNPRGGAPLKRITVTAYAFDASGAFVASGRALLDVTALAPGDQSPFVVSVPVTGPVARYRIGFRTEDGTVIGHVDRRQQSTVAMNW